MSRLSYCLDETNLILLVTVRIDAYYKLNFHLNPHVHLWVGGSVGWSVGRFVGRLVEHI